MPRRRRTYGGPEGAQPFVKKIRSGRFREIDIPPCAQLCIGSVVAAPGSTGTLTLYVRTHAPFSDGRPCRVALAVVRAAGGGGAGRGLNVPLDARFSQHVPLRLTVSGGSGTLHLAGWCGAAAHTATRTRAIAHTHCPLSA